MVIRWCIPVEFGSKAGWDISSSSDFTISKYLQQDNYHSINKFYAKITDLQLTNKNLINKFYTKMQQSQQAQAKKNLEYVHNPIFLIFLLS